MKTFIDMLAVIALSLIIFVVGVGIGEIRPAPVLPAAMADDSFDAIVTAYCPCEKCCGDSADGITASGHRIRPGEKFAAAEGRRYEFGIMVSIPGYNDGRPVPILDRGGAIKGNRIDVFFPTHAEALAWGVYHLRVKVFREDSCGFVAKQK